MQRSALVLVTRCSYAHGFPNKANKKPPVVQAGGRGSSALHEGIDVPPRAEVSGYGTAMQRDTLNFRLLDGLSAGISVCMHRYT